MATADSTPDRMSEIGVRMRRKTKAHFKLFPTPVLLQPTLEKSALIPPPLSLFSYTQTKRNRKRRTGAYSRSWPEMKVSHIDAVMTEGICEAEVARPASRDVRAQ